MPGSSVERFLSKTEPGPGGCRLWTKSTDRNGHGVFWLDGRLVGAHRAAWFFEYGTWPEGNLLHSCDVYTCTNVEHLSDGTQAANIADMVSKERQCRGEAKPNSVLTEDNVREIRAAHLTGATMVSLAAKYGVHRTTIRDVVTGRRWKSVI